MSLSRASLSPDDLVRRYVQLVRADLEPDPLFRRRLRGVVTNRYVAAREGLAEPARRSSQMGRLGRACLYASFALAMSVGGALAASRGAVPGDFLYPMKLRVEAIRLETFPQAFHDDLLVYALSERMAEFGRLVEEGELERAAELARTIGGGYQELAQMGIDVDSEELRASLAVLDALTDRLPADAQAAIERAIREAPGLSGTAPGQARTTAPDTSDASQGRPAILPADNRADSPAHESGGASPIGSPRAAERRDQQGPPAADDESTPVN